MREFPPFIKIDGAVIALLNESVKKNSGAWVIFLRRGES
jgi:hypothetical protein